MDKVLFKLVYFHDQNKHVLILATFQLYNKCDRGKDELKIYAIKTIKKFYIIIFRRFYEEWA